MAMMLSGDNIRNAVLVLMLLVSAPGYALGPDDDMSGNPDNPPALAAETLDQANDEPLKTSASRPKVKKIAHKPAADPFHPETNSFGPTRPADSLSAIAKRIAGERGQSAEQLFTAIYQANPQAFNHDDINSLQIGVILQIPDLAVQPGSSATQTHEPDAAAQTRIQDLEQQLSVLQQALSEKDQQLAARQPGPTPTPPTVDTVAVSSLQLWFGALAAAGLTASVWLLRQRKQSSPSPRSAKFESGPDRRQGDAKPNDIAANTVSSVDDADDFDFDLDALLASKNFDAGAVSDGFDLTDNDELETKIDLAKAYVDMGETSAARLIANEVLAKGNLAQQAAALALLDEIKRLL